MNDMLKVMKFTIKDMLKLARKGKIIAVDSEKKAKTSCRIL